MYRGQLNFRQKGGKKRINMKKQKKTNERYLNNKMGRKAAYEGHTKLTWKFGKINHYIARMFRGQELLA